VLDGAKNNAREREGWMEMLGMLLATVNSEIEHTENMWDENPLQAGEI
jgi:hypothetical protein